MPPPADESRDGPPSPDRPRNTQRQPVSSPPTPEEDPRDPFARQLMEYGGIGIMFPVAIALGFLAGRWLDASFGTAPWLSLVGFLFGVIAALRNLLRSVGSMHQDDSPREASDRPESDPDVPASDAPADTPHD